MFPAKKTLMVGVALIALAAPVLAEELRGRVTESFGGYVTIEDRGSRWLIRLPAGMTAPAAGTRIIADGQLDGRTLTANFVTVESASHGPRAADRGPQGRERVEARILPQAGTHLLASAVAPRLPGVTDLALRHRSRSGDLHWSGRMGASYVRVVSTWDGSVTRVETDGAALPRPVIDRVLPLRLSELEGASRLVTITSAEQRRRGEVVLRGRDAAGSELELKYDRGGRLDRVERRLPLPGLDRTSVIARLEVARYTDIGWIGYRSHHVEAEATNPYGERVEVRLNREGQIDRERLLN